MQQEPGYIFLRLSVCVSSYLICLEAIRDIMANLCRYWSRLLWCVRERVYCVLLTREATIRCSLVCTCISTLVAVCSMFQHYNTT